MLLKPSTLLKPTFSLSLTTRRTLTTTQFLTANTEKQWEGRKAKDHIVREQDNHNMQINAAKDGKKDRATSGDGTSSRGAGEESGGTNKKAKGMFVF
jgi:hypothetical protein